MEIVKKKDYEYILKQDKQIEEYRLSYAALKSKPHRKDSIDYK